MSPDVTVAIVRDLRSHCWSDMAANIGADIANKKLATNSLKFKSVAFRVQFLQQIMKHCRVFFDKHVELHCICFQSCCARHVGKECQKRSR